MGIVELAKPPYKPCANECATGCSIYEKRPEPCAGYYCVWLFEGRPDLAKVPKQLLRDDDRPDKSGLMFEASSINRDESEFEKEAGVPFLTVRETRPGAFDSHWAKKVLQRLSKRALVIRLYEDGRRAAMGPPEKLRLVGQFLQRVRVVEK
jgi:hypothetical protein